MLVVGGGITGVAAAWDAALRGLLGPMYGDSSLPRSVLSGLMARYPDKCE